MDLTPCACKTLRVNDGALNAARYELRAQRRAWCRGQVRFS
jgi:hypothetical protein